MNELIRIMLCLDNHNFTPYWIIGPLSGKQLCYCSYCDLYLYKDEYETVHKLIQDLNV